MSRNRPTNLMSQEELDHESQDSAYSRQESGFRIKIPIVELASEQELEQDLDKTVFLDEEKLKELAPLLLKLKDADLSALHDIKNLLTIMNLRIDEALSLIPEPNKHPTAKALRDNLLAILSSAESIGEITSGMNLRLNQALQGDLNNLDNLSKNWVNIAGVFDLIKSTYGKNANFEMQIIDQTKEHSPQKPFKEEVYCDGHHLARVLGNIIDNAVKIIPTAVNRYPKIKISVTQEDDYTKIEIIDNGPGFPNKKSQLTSVAPGQGIGLKYCENVLFQHNGQFFCTNHVENEQITGAAIYLIFPRPRVRNLNKHEYKR